MSSLLDWIDTDFDSKRAWTVCGVIAVLAALSFFTASNYAREEYRASSEFQAYEAAVTLYEERKAAFHNDLTLVAEGLVNELDPKKVLAIERQLYDTFAVTYSAEGHLSDTIQMGIRRMEKAIASQLAIDEEVAFRARADIKVEVANFQKMFFEGMGPSQLDANSFWTTGYSEADVFLSLIGGLVILFLTATVLILALKIRRASKVSA